MLFRVHFDFAVAPVNYIIIKIAFPHPINLPMSNPMESHTESLESLDAFDPHSTAKVVPQARAPGAARPSAQPSWLSSNVTNAPANLSSHRRTSVSAEAINPHTFNENWTPPVHQLTPSQLQRLNTSVARNFLFQQLDEESLKTIIFALEEKKVPKGTEIITQGDVGDVFYVLEQGSVDYIVNGANVNTSSDGSSFGELALMYNSPRAATVVATSDCILWALDRITFRRILLEGTSKKRAMYEHFLKEVPVLQSLSSYQRSKLADALSSESYKDGQDVVREGEQGQNFYFIEQGEADVLKEGEGIVATLHVGDYFGELALLYDTPRKATVRAKGPLKVVSLNKNGFQRLLGPAVDILKQHDPTQ